MTPAGVPMPLRFKLQLLIVLPLLTGLVFVSGIPQRITGRDGRVDLDRRAESIGQEFRGALDDALALAESALDRFPPAAGALRATSPLRQRLEGTAILNRNLEFLAWEGRPAEPPFGFADPASPRCWIRLDGVRTRLIVRAGPDEDGWIALASFVIDSSLDPERYENLIPERSRAGLDIDIDFVDGAVELTGPEAESATSALAAILGGGRSVELRAPSGQPLGVARLRPVPAELRLADRRAAGLALGGCLLVLLVLALFDWPRIVSRPLGALGAAAVIVAGRLLLILLRAPAVLLSRELGSARVYGSLKAWGLLSSPADFLLTALAVYLLCRVLVRFAFGEGSAVRRGLVMAGAPLATLFLALLSISLGHDSAAPLLSGSGIWGSAGRTILALGLVSSALGAAELWAAVLITARRRRSRALHRPRRLAVAAAFVALAGGSSVFLLRLDERLAMERLVSELAPQILEQSARREIALTAAVRAVNEAYAGDGSAARPHTTQQRYLAYHFWIRSELFHSGYKSSLDFYGPHGDFLSHFGYDLPLEPDLMDPVQGDAGPPRLVVEEEVFNPVAAVQQRLLHAEMPVLRHGEPVGIVVGHILDEPDNLPFLPGARPYLSALGPGGPHPIGDELPGGPHYVLYNAQGEVLLSTLAEPPAQTELLRLAAVRNTPVRVLAGDEAYGGVALGERDRLHLLLIPDPGFLERLAASVRLALLGLALLALIELLPRLGRRAGLASLVRSLRGSFYRKLLAALLLASVVPLIGLALFLRGYVEGRGDATLNESAVRFVGAAQRALEDYVATGSDDLAIDDGILYWLGRVVGQEIHVYANGTLQASSRPELFTSGWLSRRLDGRVQRDLVLGGRPSMVLKARLGDRRIPVAYAPVRNVDPSLQLVVAVPIVFEQREIAREIDRVGEMILLATVLLVGLLAGVAAYLARTVARPVRELVDATGQIATGEYGTRLRTRTGDEVADLVRSFNSMSEALAAQRADLESRKEYIETLLRHATTGVISIDPDGRIVTLNPAARSLLAPAAGELRPGVPLLDALGGLEALARACDGPASTPGRPVEVDLEAEPEPRRVRLVRVALPGPSDATVGTLILLDDVTDLMRSNQLAAWAEMARAIAHEIKNPLTPIQLSVEHLKRLLNDRQLLPSPEIEACLATVIKQVRTLYEIAGEFSTYAKLPDLKPEPTDPVEFMRETVAPYRAASLRDVSVQETYERTGRVAIDPKVLARAVVNLIENALQAMPEGGRLDVSVTADPERSAVRLGVRDSGRGLDPETRKRLFEPYFSTKSSGTGLGLAIVRRAVEAHQGTIEVDSRPGRGTSFSIVLPLVAAD